MDNPTFNPFRDENDTYYVVLSENREKWAKERGKGIGGSDMASIVGYNSWKTNTQLYEEKIGDREPKDLSNNSAVQYGILAEEYMRATFAEKYKDRFVMFYEPNTIFVSKQHDFLRYSPDGILYDRVTGEYGIYENKTASLLFHAQRSKWENNQIPLNYQIQVLHGLNVTGFSFIVTRAELTYNNMDVDKREHSYIVVKDQYIHIDDENVKSNMKWLKEEAITFWEDNVLKKQRPKLIVTV